jgi:DNA-binding beta-propeller fold protein YncE
MRCVEMVQSVKNSWRLLVLAAVACIITGCAGEVKKEAPLVFYPPPPNAPRIQFLNYYTSAEDVGGERSAFDKFVKGEQITRRLDKPYGVAMYNGKIYVCDTNRGLMVFDMQKKTLDALRGAQGLGTLTQPINISIDRDGTKYVSDPIRGQVVAYDKNDFYVKSYGEGGGAWKPVDAVAYEDKLYVADPKNSDIKVFDKASGDLVKRIAPKGADSLGIPTNLAFDEEGYLYVSDIGRFQVLKFDRDGHLKSVVGRLGSSSGDFSRPKGVAVDHDGRIYVVDTSFDNVQIFNKSGQLLMFFGGPGLQNGNMNLPAKVSIDYDNVSYFQKYADPNFVIEYLILVTNQFGNKMVSVYGFGKERGMKYPSDEELYKEDIERLKKLQPPPPPAKGAEDTGKKESVEKKPDTDTKTDTDISVDTSMKPDAEKETKGK